MIPVEKRPPWYMFIIRATRMMVDRRGQPFTVATVASPYAKVFYQERQCGQQRPRKPQPAGRADLIARQRKARP